MLLTAFVLLAFAAVALVGARYTPQTNDYFFCRDYTTVMKGLAAVIVVFVHFPVEHGNRLQDMVGSFGYVCVTLFFMFSAYGLRWSVEHKHGYLDHFLRNRVAVLMIPYAIMSVVTGILGFGSGASNFVLVLLFFYVVFYLSHRFLGDRPRVADGVIGAVVVAYSLAGALNLIGPFWFTESLGFAYGIILVNVTTAFGARANKHYATATVLLTGTSLALGVLYLKYKYVWFTGSYLLRIVLGVSLILLLLVVTTRVRIGNPAARHLGTISYEVFLLHEFVMRLIEKTGFTLSSGVFIVCAFAGTIALATGLNRVDVMLARRVRTT